MLLRPPTKLARVSAWDQAPPSPPQKNRSRLTTKFPLLKSRPNSLLPAQRSWPSPTPLHRLSIGAGLRLSFCSLQPPAPCIARGLSPIGRCRRHPCCSRRAHICLNTPLPRLRRSQSQQRVRPPRRLRP